jgi:uncharacterized damage-inducible protein DinB
VLSKAMLDTLVRYHAWAGQKLLDTASLLPADQLASGSLSQGSLFQALVHVVDVNQSWRSAAEGIPGLMPEEVAESQDLSALRAFWSEEDARLVSFVRSLSEADLEREVVPEWKTRPFKIWQIVLHLVTHAAEHTNEIGWALTKLGHSPGELAFMRFVDLHRSGPGKE